jgi:hypothetical protein
MIALTKNDVSVAGVCSHDASPILVRGEALNAVVVNAQTPNADPGGVYASNSCVIKIMSIALYSISFLALLLYMWVAAVWYGSFRVTGPQASMTVASAASALWKP